MTYLDYTDERLRGWYETNQHYYYPEYCFIPARKPNRFKNSGYDYGFVLDKDKAVRVALVKKGETLRKWGWQGYRKGSVPYTGKYKNTIYAKTNNGWRKEYGHNLTCEQEFPEFELVRAKRKDVVKAACDWDFYEHRGKGQRSWKRSKKRKQWM